MATDEKSTITLELDKDAAVYIGNCIAFVVATLSGNIEGSVVVAASIMSQLNHSPNFSRDIADALGDEISAKCAEAWPDIQRVIDGVPQ